MMKIALETGVDPKSGHEVFYWHVKIFLKNGDLVNFWKNLTKKYLKF